MVEFMYRKQITSTPYSNKTYHPKPKTALKKRNLVQLTQLDRSKLEKSRKINLQKFPSSTSSQINWKSTTGKILTHEAIDATCSALTNLAPMQGSQLVNNTPSPPSPPLPTASTKATKRFKILCYMHTTGQGLPKHISIVFWLEWRRRW